MFESVLIGIFLLFGISYAILNIFLWRGLNNLNHPLTEEKHSFSIVVAARNEEKRIDALLSSLVNQQYPADKFEVIIVNDRSTDSTQSVIEKYVKKYSSVKIVNITENNTEMPNKKNALQAGIKTAKNEILAFTDADCVAQPSWLSEISKHFTDNVGVVAGYSPNTFSSGNTLFNSFLHYEELKNSLWAAAGTGLNNAFMCTGRNLAYRKKVFEQVGGYEKIKHSVSGDDDLFIQLVQKETDWKVRYMTSPQSFVHTFPPESFKQFVNQRIRHISASKYYPLKIKTVYAASHSFILSILVAFFLNPIAALILLMLKFNIDAAIVARGKNIFSEEFSILEFFRDEMLLILYTFGIVPLGYVKNFSWKGARS